MWPFILSRLREKYSFSWDKFEMKMLLEVWSKFSIEISKFKEFKFYEEKFPFSSILTETLKFRNFENVKRNVEIYEKTCWILWFQIYTRAIIIRSIIPSWLNTIISVWKFLYISCFGGSCMSHLYREKSIDTSKLGFF